MGVLDGYVKYDNNASTNNEREILPIPLTEELLKANGFEMLYSGKHFVGYEIDNGKTKGSATVTFYKEDEIINHEIYLKGCRKIKIEIKYIHELQHALRLCGFSELADNFKIE